MGLASVWNLYPDKLSSYTRLFSLFFSVNITTNISVFFRHFLGCFRSLICLERQNRNIACMFFEREKKISAGSHQQMNAGGFSLKGYNVLYEYSGCYDARWIEETITLDRPV